MSRPSPSPASSPRASCRAMTRSRTRPRSSTTCSASSPSPISAATTSPISRPTRSAIRCLAAASIRTRRRASAKRAPSAPPASVVSRGLVRSKADKLMLVPIQGRGVSGSRRRLRRAWRLRPGRNRAQGRARRARRARRRLEPRAASRNRRREARRSADERLRRRILPRMRQLHHGPQRHVPEVRHLRRHDGVQLSRWPSRPGPATVMAGLDPATHAVTRACPAAGSTS